MIQKIRIIANDSAEYICKTTDLIGGKPPMIECGPGSTIAVLDPETKTIVDAFMSDGTDWYQA